MDPNPHNLPPSAGRAEAAPPALPTVAEMRWLEDSWEELLAQEVRERLALLALPPAEAQAKADVLCARLWEPRIDEMNRHIPGIDRLPEV